MCRRREATEGQRHDDQHVGHAWCFDCLEAMVRSGRRFRTGEDLLAFRR
jgi:hypothetical protein